MSFLSTPIDYLNGVVGSDTAKDRNKIAKCYRPTLVVQNPSRMEWIVKRQLLFICKQNNTMPQTTSDGMNFAQDAKQKGKGREARVGSGWEYRLGTRNSVLSLE